MLKGGGINLLWVCDWDFQDKVFRDFKQLRVIPVCLQQEGKNIKTALGSFPSQLNADLLTKSNNKVFHPNMNFCSFILFAYLLYLSKFNISRVSHNLPIRLFVACITNQLTVPYSKVMFAICPLGKYGDGRPATNKYTENI